MKLATKAAVLFSAVALSALPLGIARAQLTAEPLLGRLTDQLGRFDHQGKSATNAITTIYDGTSGAGTFGVSSTDLTSVWGDELFTAGTGLLSTHKFTIFNSGSSAGSLLTATVGISFFDAVTSAALGGYSVNVNFGTGLPPGQFSVVSVTGLDALLINLTTNDLVVLQTVQGMTGAASRLGVASMGPIVVGASPTSMYISSSTIGGGVPGWYTFSNGPADPGNFIAVIPPPVATTSKTWGSLKKLYR